VLPHTYEVQVLIRGKGVPGEGNQNKSISPRPRGSSTKKAEEKTLFPELTPRKKVYLVPALSNQGNAWRWEKKKKKVFPCGSRSARRLTHAFFGKDRLANTSSGKTMGLPNGSTERERGGKTFFVGEYHNFKKRAKCRRE